MNVLPLVLYVAAGAAYAVHFARRRPDVGRLATTLLILAALSHTFVIGMQTMEVRHVPFADPASAVGTFVWLLALSYVGVLSHPFFDVTKSHEDDGGDKSKRGTFEIKELPAGEYEIEAWHESFGTQTQKVTVKDGETKEIEFKFGAKKAEAPSPTRTVILGAESGGQK